jgi:phosphosulfolactate synthase
MQRFSSERSVSGRAWDDLLCDPIPGRLAKKRTAHGLTMLIDTGLGLQETRDLVELAAPYIDYLKLGFGTSKLYPSHLLTEKIQLLKEQRIDVYPGGTFLEIAILQNKWQPFLERCLLLGMHTVEVSDGTITLPPKLRRLIIREAKSYGFNVFTEVGKKENGSALPVEVQLALIEADLEAGANKVIIEGRESGKAVGLYKEDGTLRRDDFDALVERVADPADLIWEAPLKSQQIELIQTFGPNVNLGNIHPRDAISLEALRTGLRSDTLRQTL